MNMEFYGFCIEPPVDYCFHRFAPLRKGLSMMRGQPVTGLFDNFLFFNSSFSEARISFNISESFNIISKYFCSPWFIRLP